MTITKELTEAEIRRLAELRARWWEVDKEAAIRMMYVIAEQEKIETDILAIVLGER